MLIALYSTLNSHIKINIRAFQIVYVSDRRVFDGCGISELYCGVNTVCFRFNTHRYNTNSVTTLFEFGPQIFSMEIVLYYRPTTFSFTQRAATWDTLKYTIEMPKDTEGCVPYFL